LIAGVITWETDVYSLITLASRCFALYYALECLQATFSVNNRGEKLRAIGYALLTAVAIAIVIVGAPAESG
jgi:VanZ family protein